MLRRWRVVLRGFVVYVLGGRCVPSPRVLARMMLRVRVLAVTRTMLAGSVLASVSVLPGIAMLSVIHMLAGVFVLAGVLAGIAMLISPVLFVGHLLTGTALVLCTFVLCTLVLCAFIFSTHVLSTLVLTRVVRLYQSRFAWVALVLGELLGAIMNGVTLVRTLFLRQLTAPFLGSPFLLGNRSPVDTTRPVEANPVMLFNEGAVNISVVDVHTHMRAGAVIEKMAAFPMATPKTGSEITKPIVDTPIEAHA
jgi:hypothetical protein